MFIGIPEGEELFVSLHPLFTTLHRQIFKKEVQGREAADCKSVGTDCRQNSVKVKSGEEWVKSARTLFTPRNADKHRGFGAFGEE